MAQAAMAYSARLRIRAAAGDHEQDLPGRGGNRVLMDSSANRLSFVLHHLFRSATVVRQSLVQPSPRYCTWADSLDHSRWAWIIGSVSDPNLHCGLVRLLHGLPRGGVST